MSKETENILEVTEENEMDLIQGLLTAADYKKDIIQPIAINRGGENPLFTFNIRPLSVDEVNQARKQATTMMANPNNPKLPPIAKEVSEPDFLAWEIYFATEGTPGQKLWDNPSLKAGLQKQGHDIMEPIDVIKAVLRSGELAKVTDVIDSISGDGESLIDYAKN